MTSTTTTRIPKACAGLLLVLMALPALAQITLYENPDFGGRAFSTDSPQSHLADRGFNDRASSIVVERDGWQACDDADYGGRCVDLRPGRYPSLQSMGLNDRVSSIRPSRLVSGPMDDRNRAAPVPAYPGRDEYRRRDNERLFEANVTDVRAVMGAPEQRCWVEREAVAGDERNAGVPGALAGAVLGGILGHQIGGGFGRDLTTVGGAVAGAALGNKLGRDNQPTEQRDVKHCANDERNRKPAYWDVTYTFRGQQHRMQMNTAPRATVTVNRLGEPRG